MKLFALLFLCSCATTVSSPLTGIEYKGTIDAEGIGVKAKPPFWSSVCKLYQRWVGDDDE